MEWSDKYNPFNSMKALVHAKHFEQILEGNILPPIVVNMDLTNICNYSCGFCMFGGRKRADKSGETFRFNGAHLSSGYVLLLPKIWKKWGVKAVCLAGGGEPSLHPDCLQFIKECKKQGLDLGFVTNGYKIDTPTWLKTLAKCCKFVGFSVDAGTEQDYSATKGVPPTYFNTVIKNIKQLAETRDRLKTDLQIGYKFILDEKNWKSIYRGAKIACKIGINHFQFRPAIDPNYRFFKDKLDKIWGQISKAQKDFERKDYHIFGIQHKFNPDLSKKHNFEKCRATFLTTTWAADGWVYMCTDTRGCKWSKLVKHYPNPRKVIDYWGSPEHISKVDKIEFKKNCDRCTLGPYNEMFEQVFIQDKMDKNLI